MVIALSFRSTVDLGKTILLLFLVEGKINWKRTDCNEKLEAVKVEYIFYKFAMDPKDS